ncbi:hypothetical protein, partial [Cohaesibacter haloalkalitolerans]|uniref:hypothetical protein n=1 Tax=Cohaesibacter haloalkalitolerans TaxID=1162980 RepID=UPI001968DDD2
KDQKPFLRTQSKHLITRQIPNFEANRPAASSAAAVDERTYRPHPNQSQTIKYIFMTSFIRNPQTYKLYNNSNALGF